MKVQNLRHEGEGGRAQCIRGRPEGFILGTSTSTLEGKEVRKEERVLLVTGV